MAKAIEQVEPEKGAEPRVAGLTARSLILAVLLMVPCALWIQKSEVVEFFCQITESVPAVPAVAVLIALALINPFVRRLWGRLALRRTEVLLIYCFIVVAVSTAGPGVVRFFLTTTPALFYFATPENGYQEYWQYIPSWWLPQNPEVIRQLYEGSAHGEVPWMAWLPSLGLWLLFFLALWIVMMCLIVLVRRQWVKKEKLTFPILYLPLELTEGLDTRALLGSFLKNRLMWIGFGLAAIYNIANIANAYNPAIKCLGKYYNIGALFVDRPLSYLRPMSLHYRPDMIGFGYLVSTEVALSIWVFYFLMKLEGLGAGVMGYERAGFPHAQEQALGAYVAMAIFLLWIGRRQVADFFRKALLNAPDVEDRDEPLSYRTALVLLIAGLVFLLGWCVYSGMALWVAAMYLGLILAVAFTQTRVRAETGIPQIWSFPYYQAYKSMTYLLGSRVLQVRGSWSTLTILTSLVWLSRGYYPALMGYQIDSFRLGQQTGIKPKAMTWLLILALIVGIAFAYWLHLDAWYEYGSGIGGGWGTGLSRAEYNRLADYALAPQAPDVSRTVMTAWGFLFTSILVLIRTVLLRFPLHPLAFGISMSYPELVWGSFFLVWIIKSLVFKLGGMRTYRMLIPGFLGFALGHFFTAGIAWGIIGAFGGEAAQRYYVYFG